MRILFLKTLLGISAFLCLSGCHEHSRPYGAVGPAPDSYQPAGSVGPAPIYDDPPAGAVGPAPGHRHRHDPRDYDDDSVGPYR